MPRVKRGMTVEGMFRRIEANVSRQMQQVRHEDAERGNGAARQRQQAGDAGQRNNPGDNRCRAQHDSDLKGRLVEVEEMVLALPEAMTLLGVLAPLGQLLPA